MTPSRPADPAPLLQRAARALQTGDFATAERSCRAVLKTAPNHPGALHLLGQTGVRAGHAEAGIALLRQAVAAAPRYAEAWTSLGRALASREDLQEAEQAFARALAARPGHWPAVSGLAALLKTTGRLAEAQDRLRQASRERPTLAGPPFELANIAQEQGDFADASALYTEALARQPGHTPSLSNRAAARLKAGDAAGALADAEAYLATGTRSANVVAYRVLALQMLGRRDEARALADVATMVYPVALAAEPGFGERLEAEIRRHPDLIGDWDPTRRAARGGQVVPDLTRNPSPTVARFLAMIRAEVEGLRERLPDRPGHPFFGAKPRDYRMIVWANILAPGGHQAAHIHNYGWVSGAYYPTLPAAITERSEAGWISFGTPGYGLPSPPEPEIRTLRPRAGSMFLFPSYLWHHTVPLEAGPLETGAERVSIAFDIVPA
ncbi:MAG: tetratricopeptide repeat protein [Alphaproteobacteria bacterium]|nr:tetratricopeptide repeat protein [Alphaproteobacteria bacterium]MCB9928737.1 tetratricopeptide repeat protein [Alphaproteobacteria bacterium]